MVFCVQTTVPYNVIETIVENGVDNESVIIDIMCNEVEKMLDIYDSMKGGAICEI